MRPEEVALVMIAILTRDPVGSGPGSGTPRPGQTWSGTWPRNAHPPCSPTNRCAIN